MLLPLQRAKASGSLRPSDDFLIRKVYFVRTRWATVGWLGQPRPDPGTLSPTAGAAVEVIAAYGLPFSPIISVLKSLLLPVCGLTRS